MADIVDEPISSGLYSQLSGKPGAVTVANPPFHPNILNVGGGNSATNPTAYNGVNAQSKLQRGRIVGGAGAYYGSSTTTNYVVNFLYNPATIYESRAIDMNTSPILPASARNPGDTSQYATGLSTNISFSLLFDRTYELWDRGYIDTLAGRYGARVDVEALFNLTGINTVVSSNSSANTAPLQSSVTTQGPMIVSLCNLYFGASNAGALSYYGYISELDITWSHFNYTMTPARCEVDISFTVMPISTSNYTG